MSNQIKVDISKLRAASSQFETTSAQIKNATNNMVQTVEQLSGAIWSGEAATAYTSKFRELRNEITAIDRMVQEHTKDLTRYANEYEKAEKANVGRASALNAELF